MGAWGHDGLWGGGVKTGVLWARVSKKELHLEHGEGLKWGATALGLRIRTGSVHLGEGALFTRITCSAGRCEWQVPGAPWRTQAPSGASFLEVEAWLGPRGASVVMSWGAGPGCEIGGYPLWHRSAFAPLPRGPAGTRSENQGVGVHDGALGICWPQRPLPFEPWARRPCLATPNSAEMQVRCKKQHRSRPRGRLAHGDVWVFHVFWKDSEVKTQPALTLPWRRGHPSLLQTRWPLRMSVQVLQSPHLALQALSCCRPKSSWYPGWYVIWMAMGLQYGGEGATVPLSLNFAQPWARS